MFAHDSGRLAAIVDWEMCTIGDPLLDLGWLLATWPEPGRPGAVGSPLANAGGLCTPQEALEHYARHTTRDLSAIAWYKVLACFKLGIVLEGTHARAFAGKATKPVGDMLHATTVALFKQAVGLIEEG
jgi:aminoglycoside phosphotransferase (APT) family kinase protein